MELKLYVGKQVFESIEDYMTLEDFYQKCEEWTLKDKSSWNHVTLMAYFVCKYRKTYGVRYKMTRWKNNPAKSKESLDMSRLMKQFKVFENGWEDSNKNTILKCYNYINWIFDRKFKHQSKVNSTGLLLNHTLINEFEKLFSKKMKEFNNKNIVLSLNKWIAENVSEISDDYEFNDLNDVGIFINYYNANNFGKEDQETMLFAYIKENIQ